MIILVFHFQIELVTSIAREFRRLMTLVTARAVLIHIVVVMRVRKDIFRLFLHRVV